ncbi:MAG: RNA methyltransferase [Cyanobacteria bacterium J06626_23]
MTAASDPITSLQNPLIRQIRKLHQAKERHRQGTFLLEGTHLVEEACAVGYPLQQVLYTADWQARYPNLADRLPQQAAAFRQVSPEVLKSTATTVNPDGVIATAARRPQSVDSSLISLGLAVERLQDPGNLGSIIRTGAAAGVNGLWLSADSVDIDHPKVLRASAGQWFRSPLQVWPSLGDGLSRAQAAAAQAGSPLQVVATTPTAAMDYWSLDCCQPTLFLLGNEGSGLSAPLLAAATQTVKIPLAAGVESLNVAIAAALLLYEARRQRTSLTH